MSRKRDKLNALAPEMLTVTKLGHDGRGIAHRADGKLVFVDGALPGEDVLVKLGNLHKKYDEGRAIEVLNASPDRVAAPCVHFGVCGGCSLQHMSRQAQLDLKQSVLAEQLKHFGGIEPLEWLPPLVSESNSYRRKARMGVRYVIKKEKLLVGFRERQASFLAELDSCVVMDPRLGLSITAFRELINGLAARDHIPQIEVAAGDELDGVAPVALVFRHMIDLSDSDRQALIDFCAERGWQCYLQPGNYDTVHKVWPVDGPDRLAYELPFPAANGADLRLAFHPNDFTQVNADINRQMLPLALELLETSAEHRVLDLFCGLGNFTLPLATKAREVVGVEGSEAMVRRGQENATANGLSNVSFYSHDLTKDIASQPWAALGFDRVLIDPPRSGALEILPHIVSLKPQRVVYVSCNPATLARDAGELAKAGYVLLKAGIMDMFTHTTHVESIAVFEKRA
ncbi:23S rRNA m(5)U-1939 methyltransferase [Paraperlucidibaca baekdonensis]|uniref:23S rRNA (uracil(1939)-C(5))-methyltransferase RlmD n=1 Tax=Paraperlucidibaca baekdonensis TaxID=748120 RepID=A0A3E0H459_9GAMM|nr:23S rRNA (uracil(1939)-C(5))-methyltransferase RlmD [Paraperlucidibaca baekdonensis]REH37604.1 23S rRNA m(5)U-1939 methyltransferase [Paraperlucidibaca baekdonensis]